MTDMICRRCQSPIDELSVFPGGICLACHEKKFDAEVARTGRLPRPDFVGAINFSSLPKKYWAIVAADTGRIIRTGNDVGMTLIYLASILRPYGDSAKVVFGDKSFAAYRPVGEIFGYTWQQISDMQQKR